MSSGGRSPAWQRAELRVGRVLRGKWRLDRVLGVGGIAAVYEATHRAGKRVAVKVLHTEFSAHEDTRSRFIREAHVANRVEHPGVVSVADDDVSEEGEAFLVMDLLDGETLDVRRKRLGGALDAMEVLKLAEQALDVLAVAHDKGIVHRDLKPENLFLTRDGKLMVLDFGIARLRELSSQDHATQTGMVMGTPAFMPPEQARGRWELVEARSDLWALGATMFTLLSGRLVHGGLTVNEAIAAAITRAAPPLRSAAPEVAEPIAIVVDRALVYDIAARWPDARSMQKAVRAAMESLNDVATTLPLTSPSQITGAAPRPMIPSVPSAPSTPPVYESPGATWLDNAGSSPLVSSSPTDTGSPVARSGIGIGRKARTVGAALAIVVVAAAGLILVIVFKSRHTSSGDAGGALSTPVNAESPAASVSTTPTAPAAASAEAPPLAPSAVSATALAPAVTPSIPERPKPSRPIATQQPPVKPPPSPPPPPKPSSDPFGRRTR